MARSIATIQQQIINNLVTTSAAKDVTVDPTQWSAYDFRQLMTFVAAVGIALLEQIQDAFKVDVEAIKTVMPPQTPAWFQNQLLNVFEYDAIAVPIVQLDTTTNFVPTYPNPNPAFNIVKYCSVVSGAFLGTTAIKIAGAGPSQIVSPALDAAQSFINTVGAPGITYNAVSLDADRLFMQLDVYYQGLYSAIIQSAVIAAITAYLAGIPFDGYVTLSDLEAAIKRVAGVNDVVFVNVQARANTTTVLTGTNLVLNQTLLQRNWGTVAGYIVTEDTADYTLIDPRISAPSLNNLNLISQ